jgi:hypothetical protein
MNIRLLRSSLLGIAVVFAVACAASAAAEDYDFKFHSYPNPFVPGYEDAAMFYTLPADGIASIDVYDFRGKLVRAVTADALRPLGVYDGDDVWDGRDGDGEIVLPGAYVIVLEVVINGVSYRDTFTAVVNR